MRPPAVLAVAALAGVAACSATPTTSGPGTPIPSTSARPQPGAVGTPRAAAPAPNGSATRSTPRTPVTHVRGTVVRVSVESQGEGGDLDGKADREAAIATWLQTPTGRVKVRTSSLTAAPTGSTVDADVTDDAPVTTASGPDAVAAAESGAHVVTARVTRVPAEPALRAGVHDVTVVLAAPAGTSPDATTRARLAATVDGAVSRFWSAQTGGRVRWHVVRSVGWLHLRSRCDDAWSLWAEAAARAGFVPGRDRHLLVLVPATAAGCFAGLGTIGASSDAGGYAYVRGTLPGLVAHELGHNLGLGHSNGLQCDGVADGTWAGSRWTHGCVRTGYRDWYDVMGVSWEHLGTLSTAQAWRLGALPAAQVVTVSKPARVTLTAVGLASGVRSLRVQTPGGTYVIEYRAAVGADAWLADDWRGLRPGVLVRRDDPEDDSEQTLLLDASPSPAAGFADDWDEPLPVGGSLTTADGRVVIRVESATATTARVAVVVDGIAPAPPVGPLGARSADAGSNRVVRQPLAGTPRPSPTPSASASPTDGELTRRPMRTPSR